MAACCAPNPVHVEAECYVWCEVPKSHLHNSSRDDIASYILSCLSTNGRQPRAFGVHMATSAAAGGRVLALKKLALWVLLVSGACGFATLM